MCFHKLTDRHFLFLYGLSFIVFVFGAIAQEDACLSYYYFEDTSDTPNKNQNFKNNGWKLDESDNSYVSDNQPKISSFFSTNLMSFWISVSNGKLHERTEDGVEIK